MSKLRLQGLKIDRDGTAKVLVVAMREEDMPQVGDILQVGVELPPIPGLRGHYMVTDAHVELELGEMPSLELELQPADPERLQAHSEALLQGLTERDWGETPNWTTVWDRLEFLEPHRRREALRQIQARHRDRENERVKRERIAAMVRAEAERKRKLEEDEAREIVRRADQQIAREKFEKFEPPKHRKIDLED